MYGAMIGNHKRAWLLTIREALLRRDYLHRDLEDKRGPVRPRGRKSHLDSGNCINEGPEACSRIEKYY